MRTQMEVMDYISSKKWYLRYVSNIKQEWGFSEMTINALLSGSFGIKTVENAFVWHDTPEGHDYWSRVNAFFTEWYDAKQ